MRTKIPIIFLFLIFVFSFSNFPSFAGENVETLKKQIEALQKRVEELESSKIDQEDNSWGFYNRRSSGGFDPFAEMHRMREEMDQMFQNSFNRSGGKSSGIFSNSLNFGSDFDLKETDEGYEILFDMKGLNKDKVDIEINENSITVRGEQSSEEQEENPNSYFQSRSFGTFMKTIPLPMDADTTKVKTEKQGDHLVIRLPKKTS